MRPNLITRLKEEWNNLDPVDPLRGLIADAIDALAKAQPSQSRSNVKPWIGLTEQERNDLEDYCEMIIGKAAFEAIEAKLREKNT